jgi:hypothetical protein
VFATSIHCHQRQIFASKARSFTRLHSNGRLQALPANIRIEWKKLKVANTLAYNDTSRVTAVKIFIRFPALVCTKKLFTAAIFARS